MATLAVDTPRVYHNGHGHPDYNEIPIIASDTVYLGAAVGESSTSGTGRPLVGADAFKGFCIEQCANEGGAASAKNIKLFASGKVELVVTGVDNANDEGSTVYASDDNTFTLTSSTGFTAIGKVERVLSATGGKALVYFEADYRRSI